MRTTGAGPSGATGVPSGPGAGRLGASWPSAGRNTFRCEVGAASVNPSSSSPVTRTEISRGETGDTDTTSARRGGFRRRGRLELLLVRE